MVTNPAAALERPTLARTVGPFQLTLYALGSMLGSGIYGLIGKAAGNSATPCGCRSQRRSLPRC